MLSHSDIVLHWPKSDKAPEWSLGLLQIYILEFSVKNGIAVLFCAFCNDKSAAGASL